MRHRLLLFVVVALYAVSSAAALDPKDARAEYDRLQNWRFSSPVTLSAPVTLTRDTATWTFTSGTVRLMEPATDGTVTGVVFEGEGRFRMTIPDRYELAQLRRFAKKPDLQEINEPFTQLVLRTTDAAAAKTFPAGAAPYSAVPLATKRFESWLVDGFEDVDARIIASFLNPGASQFVADMNTAGFDWLTYDFDSSRPEEIQILRKQPKTVESWISLDRAEDRRSDGRPSAPAVRATLTHIDVKADLTKLGSSIGGHEQREIRGKYVVEGTFTGVAESTGALELDLHPVASEVTATDEGGAPLTVIRDHIGKRSMDLANELHDDDFVVILPRPLRRGESQKVRFAYELETGNYAAGRSWYPTVTDSLAQRHTARLQLTVGRKNEVRSMGRMESRSENGNTETSVWIVDRPAKMVTFSTATRFEEVKVNPTPKIPPVYSFGPDYQFSNTAKLRNVAADVANSMQYFQNLFGSEIGGTQFYVTSIAAGHGQAFDGFLHMSESTFTSEHPGASELFRAHEVAHEWWGHRVGWSTYRDQWLSEAFAEYCAMMFVQGFVQGGEKHFAEILRSYDGIVKGNLSGGFSKFNRPWLIERSGSERARVGPIGHGYRAATNEIPAGYVIQTYYKGPLVLHMLRNLLGFRTGSDEVFVKTLRDFLHEYDGRDASTEDFRRVLERNTGGADFGWFFDAWIYRPEIPSYSWDWSVRQEGDSYLMTLKIDRRDVTEGFMTLIPVKVEFDDGKIGWLFIPNRQASQTTTHKLPARPKNVVFAPDSSLLANIRRQ